MLRQTQIKTLSFLSVVLAASAFVATNDRHWLITPEEAALVGGGGGGRGSTPMILMGTETSSGPLIVVKRPEMLERSRPPVTVRVDFLTGQSGLAPDLSSLTITVTRKVSANLSHWPT